MVGWSKYSTAGRYAVRGAVGGWEGESGSYAVRGAAGVCVGGIRLVQRDGGMFAVAVVVLRVAVLQLTWTQLRSRVSSAILRWTLL